MNNVEFLEHAMINGKMYKNVFRCHKDDKIPFCRTLDMVIDREVSGNFVSFTILFGNKSMENPLYALMVETKQQFINTEK